eukprot:GSMAST32.ASY1.ANO1.1464.1 assembled CDS
MNQRLAEQVKRVIAVTSCKGGVGKSSVSLGLARALRAQGLSVGILDTDVQGPSLPSFLPQALDGIYCMSWGLLPTLDGGKFRRPDCFDKTKFSPAVFNGREMVRIVIQMVHGTDWSVMVGANTEPLDILLIDTPPGTGDVAMSLMASLHLTAAVVVSTPSPLASCDVLRGTQLLNKFKVPIIAHVENMAYQINVKEGCKISSNDVSSALRSWCDEGHFIDDHDSLSNVLKYLNNAENTFSKVKLHSNEMCEDISFPFGPSALEEFLISTKRNQKSNSMNVHVEGYQLPLSEKYSPSSLISSIDSHKKNNNNLDQSEKVFSNLALHVRKQCEKLPMICEQEKNTMSTGDPSLLELQNWFKFLYRIKRMENCVT